MGVTKSSIAENILANAVQLREFVQFCSDSIVSKTLLDKQAGSLTLFAFDKGQRLNEHTSPYDAAVLVIEGTAQITIGGKHCTVKDGQLIVMPAGIPHAVNAAERFKMLLIMIR